MLPTETMRVVVVSGLHHAARSRTVDHLLRAIPGSIAVHHDLGAIADGEVRRVVRDARGVLDERPVELVHACITCTLREDLLPFLLDLAGDGAPPVCLVETWEGVEPRLVAEAFDMLVDGRPVSRRLHLAAVITAVDAGLLIADLSCDDDIAERGLGIAVEDDRTVAEVLTRQIEYPTILALAGEPADEAHREERRALLEHLNPAAAVLPVDSARLPDLLQGRFDPRSAAVRLDPLCAQYLGLPRSGRVRTVTWRRRRPMDPGRLHAALDELVAAGLRSRGRFWLASRPDTVLLWDAGGGALAIEPAGPWLAALPEGAWELASEARRAAARMDWDPETGDRGQCLSFTGIDLDEERLVALLDACLLTDEEMGEPGGPWTRHTDPFAEILDAAS
ncbi:GTP-binding protein [Marinactinospora endophytica]